MMSWPEQGRSRASKLCRVKGQQLGCKLEGLLAAGFPVQQDSGVPGVDNTVHVRAHIRKHLHVYVAHFVSYPFICQSHWCGRSQTLLLCGVQEHFYDWSEMFTWAWPVVRTSDSS